MLQQAVNTASSEEFQSINQAYDNTFRPNRLTLGLVVPLENYSTSAVPDMNRHIERVQLVEELGFYSVWLRDVPFNVPSFGDAGQMFDPFVYLGVLAAQTKHIALGVASIVLPLRHPAHIAKAAASGIKGSELLKPKPDNSSHIPFSHLPVESKTHPFMGAPPS